MGTPQNGRKSDLDIKWMESCDGCLYGKREMDSFYYRPLKSYMAYQSKPKTSRTPPTHLNSYESIPRQAIDNKLGSLKVTSKLTLLY